MEISVKQIADAINGKIVGDENQIISKFSKIEDGEVGAIAFLSNSKYNKFIYKTKASAVIVNDDFTPETKVLTTIIKVEDSYVAFAKLLEFYESVRFNYSGISEQSFISKDAKIGEDVYVGDFTYIAKNAQIGNNVKIHPQVYIGENATIGDNCILYPGVKIYFDSRIGKNCIFHSGVVVGSDGFGFAPEGKEYVKIPQIGNVIIEDDVEIGSNCTIDRATMGSTIIRKGVKLDNLIQIGHNAEIGKNTVLVSQSGISGSTKIGENCMIGGQVGVAGHLIVADGVKIAAQSGIGSHVKKEGVTIMGSPAFDIAEHKRSLFHFKNFSFYVEKIRNLENELKEIKEMIGKDC